MSVRSLSSGAEACITRGMELDGNEADAVRSYILKQMNENFCEMLVYRVVQLVKSFFGRSDLQACQAMIANSFMHRAIEQGIIQENPDNALESRLKRKASELFSHDANGLLALTLFAHSQNYPNTSELKNRCKSLRFSNYRAELAKLRVQGNRMKNLLDCT